MLSQSVSMRWSRSSTGSSKISSLLRVLAIISIVAAEPDDLVPRQQVMSGRACARPLHSLPITLLVALGVRSAGGRRRWRRGRVIGGRGGRLGAARDPFQPFDLLDVRYQHFVLGLAGELRPDDVRLRTELCELLTPDGVRSGDAGEEVSHFLLGGFPEDRFLLQVAHGVD